MTTQKSGHEWRFSIVLIALMVTAFMLVSSAAAADTGAKFKGFGGTGPYPVANFSADKVTGQAPLTVQLFDNSTYEGTLVSRLWDFGALGTSTAANPSITFTAPGTYTVSLRVENATGFVSNESGEKPIGSTTYTLPFITVTAGTDLAADYTVNPASGSIPVGYTAQFNDTSVGNPTAWLWDFGDSTPTSTLQNPTHVFSVAQIYSVKLTITNATGHTATTTKPITVNPATAPVANFTNSTADGTGVAPLNVTFTDTSLNLPTSWAWQFGDGATSTLQNPYHVFSLPGNHQVNLTATNGAGSSTTSYWINTTGPKAPIANFTANGNDATAVSPGPTLIGAAPFSVAFVDNSSTDADRQASSWLWTFGDGQQSTSRNVTHVFQSAGTYNVQFTATNSGGSSSAFMTIQVGPTTVPVANFQFNTTDSAADGAIFTNAEMLVTNKAIWFNSTSTNAPTSTSWTFSDGVTSTQTNFTRTFSTAGNYWVLLSVSNSAGSGSKINFFTITDSVVGAKPVSNFTMDCNGVVKKAGETLTVTYPAVVNFTNTSTNNPTSWTWFEDGTQFATTKDATYTFNQVGTFPIQLIVANANGTSSASGTVVVQAPANAPVANFTYTPTEAQAAPATFQFTDTSTNNPTAWSWNFDDGQTSTLQNPSHIFQNPGNYTVRLTATNSVGSNTTTKLITVTTLQPPVASFTASSATAVGGNKTSADAEIQGPIPFVVNFTSTSTMNPTSFLWQVTGTGVSFTRTTNAFDYTFDTPGKYNVQLTVYNAAGQNVVYKSAYVNVTPSAPAPDFTWTPTSPIKGQPVQFTDTTLYGPTGWSWSFGDGGLSSAQNPSHTYANAGNYTVTLTTWNSVNGPKTVSKTITVADLAPPVANFTWSPEEPKVGDLVTFTDASTNNPTSWTWVIENTQYNVQNPSVTFTTPGLKIAFLIATNAAGSSAAKLVQINVAEVPVTITPTPEVPIVADFTMDTNTGVAPLAVQFVSTSTGPYTSLDWTILLGEDVVDTMVGETPSFTFANPGTYTVLLEASNSGTGEVATKEQTVTVTATPTTTVTTTVTTTAIGGNQPFPSAHVMPGRVEAEDYDITAGYPAYSDTTAANEGGAYRQDAVDIEVGGSNYNVGWIRPTEFLTYSVDVPTGAAGAYTIAFRMANPSGAKSFNVYVDGVSVGTVNLPATGSFNTWTTVQTPSVQMTEGRHVIKVDFPSTTSINFDYMDIQGGAPVTTTTTVVTTTTTAQPTTGGATFTAAPIPVKKSSAIKFTVTPAPGKTIKSAWWTFDKAGHYNTWNSRTINPTFYYPAVGTYTPLVILTYTDGTTQTVEKAGYVQVIA